MAEPTDQDIEMTAGIMGVDPFSYHNLIYRALKAHNGNLEAVMNEYFDNPDKFTKTHTWDENAFAADRDGTDVPEFRIQGPDEHTVIQGVPFSEGHPGAPSRPPSRNQTPLGRLCDETLRQATIHKSQEDLDLEKALAESRVTANLPPAATDQETGVTGQDTSLPFFGPATRESYSQNQWGMVVSNREAQEPLPSERKRIEGAPVFLRCRDRTFGHNNLGAVLTILHEIPAARNVFLTSGTLAANYGHNKDWWRGSPILPQRSEEQEEEQWGADEPEPDVSEELHRLMAFLDSTDRAYGTADVLANLKAIKARWQNAEDSLFEELKDSDKNGACATLWTTVEMMPTKGDGNSSPKDFAVLDINLAREQYAKSENLYNLLDCVLWPELLADDDTGNVAERTTMAAVTAAGDVTTIRINGDGLPPGFQINETLYYDRYMAAHKDQAVELQDQLGSVYRALQKAERLQDRLLKWVEASGRVRDRRDLGRIALENHQDQLWSYKASALWDEYEERQSSPDDSDFALPEVDDFTNLPDHAEDGARHIEAQTAIHENVLASIDDKLSRLEKEREACLALLRELGKRNTVPWPERNWNATRRYHLRGVIISPDEVFVRRRSEGDLIELDDASDPRDQWWHLGYLSDVPGQTLAKTATLEEVLQAAASKGDRKPTLIYASDRAMMEEPIPLSDPLRTFVRFDNRLFKQDQLEETPRDRKRSSSADPASSPSKRLQQQQQQQQHLRHGSPDSMATNRASDGDFSDRLDDLSDRNADDDLPDVRMTDVFADDHPGGDAGSAAATAAATATAAGGGFQDHEGALGTEMVQLAISQPLVVGEAQAASGSGAGGENEGTTGYADWEHPEGRPLSGGQTVSPPRF